jgi:CRISPR-associated endonuclease Cas3-HD
MDVSKVRAKSNSPISLIDHSIATLNVVKTIASQLKIDDELKKDICRAALLHDIGKAYHKYQDYITNEIETETNNILHHQISWCFSNAIFNEEKHNSMLNAIYWHHPEPFSKEKIKPTNIFKEMSKDDIKLMVDIVNYYLDHKEFSKLFEFENKLSIDKINKPNKDSSNESKSFS